MAVVTNKPLEFASRVMAHVGLAPLLPVVIAGDMVPARKPDPAPLRAALARLQVATPHGWMIGDGLQDLRAGRAAGLRTVACLYGFHPAAALRREEADLFWRAFGVPETD